MHRRARRQHFPNRLVIPMMHVSRFAPLVAGFVFAVAMPSSADAQFGGLINKAKDKMAEKASEKMGPVAPGEQLSEDLLGKVITGAQAADRALGDRDRVSASRDAKNKDLSAMMEKNGPTHQAYEQASSKINECRSASFSNLERTRNKKMEADMTAKRADPAYMGKMQLVAMKYAKAMSEAQQKNDPVALQKAQAEMMKEATGFDLFPELKKDTVTTDTKCGKPPAMPAALIQEEATRKAVAAADDSIRTLEAQAVNTGAQASGLEQVRYLQLKERALSIMNRLDGKGAAVRYGDEEIAAVKKRTSDLERVKRAL